MASSSVGSAARDAVLDPAWLPHSFDPAGERLTFVRIGRDERRRLPFLWDEHFGGRFEKRVWPVGDLVRHLGEAPSGPVHFLFHSAFCGSTLLSRALEALAPVTALKEPALLNNLVHRHLRGGAAAEAARLDLALRLLARPLPGEEAVVLKPTNFVNPIAAAMLRSRPQARALFLVSDLRTFLKTIARRGLGGRSWGRQLYVHYARATRLDLGYSADEILQQTDLQAAALGWLMQMAHLRRAVLEAGSGRSCRLTFAGLKDEAAATVERAGAFLGLDSGAAGAVAAGEVFRRHAKHPGSPWRAGADDSAFALPALAEEVEMVAAWAERVAERFGLALDLADG